ncbi:MAG TPA: ATP-binding protein [Limnochordia bacterium]|jgi:two-component system sensor histidine kinase DegS|nr:ATP-binding protein [Limnochordia bacterium]
MAKELLSTQTLEDILKRTRMALEEGRSQIFEVAEAAQQECTRTEVVLQTVQSEMEQAIADVEDLTRRFARIRVDLLRSNRDFHEYSEAEKRRIYEEAEQIRSALAAAKERERLLRVRRDNLQQTLAKLREIAAKAESLVSQVGMALTYLSGNLDDMSRQLEHMHIREQAGQEMLRGQEIERKRMAGALHDGPVQDLAHLVVQLEITERLYQTGRQAEALDKFGDLKRIAQGAMADLRRIIYDLNPMTLDDLGLVLTINNYLDNLSAQTGVDTRFVLLGQERRLEPQLEMAVFRIVQEAANNALKHAQASLIEVTLEYRRQQISVSVRDDGIGFDAQSVQEKLKSGRHFGLLNMQSRANVLGGSLQFQGEPGKGARVLATIPLVNGEGGEVK